MNQESLTTLLDAAREYATQESLGLVLLWSDMQSKRVGPASEAKFVRSALAAGHAAADDLCSRFGSLTPEGYASRLGVAVHTTDRDPLRGDQLLYAEYCDKSSEILLYQRALDHLRSATENDVAGRYFGGLNVSSLFIAHELYHCVEARRRESPIARRHRVVLIRVGPFRWHSGLSSLGEIAAGCCAQRLLRLEYHPKMLDFVTLHAFDPATATAALATLRQAAAVVANWTARAPHSA